MTCDLFTDERWYVVQTQPGRESWAIFHLERQGYTVFCPRYRKTVRHARKTRQILAPVFPNYLFLQLDVSRRQWRSINCTRGVTCLIMQGEVPQAVPPGVVEALQVRFLTDGTIDQASAFKIGQAIRIVDGPFEDFVGKMERLDSAGRVRVLLDLLGRSVSVALRCQALMFAA